MAGVGVTIAGVGGGTMTPPFKIQAKPRRKIPCGPCVACCKNEQIFLHPEYGDNPSDYLHSNGMLHRNANGDCIYLQETGCAIYHNAPYVCRQLDCRVLINIPEIPSDVVRAAKRLKRTAWSMKHPIKRVPL